MNKLVAIVFPDENRAESAYETMRRLEKEGLIDIADALYVTRNKDGKTNLHQAAHLTGEGAVTGGMWGLVVGLIFLNPILGAAVGAGTGAVIGKTVDYGIDDKFVKDLGNKLKPETSALFVSYDNAVADKVLPEISRYGGEVLHTTLSTKSEKKLQKALDTGNKAYRQSVGA